MIGRDSGKPSGGTANSAMPAKKDSVRSGDSNERKTKPKNLRRKTRIMFVMPQRWWSLGRLFPVLHSPARDAFTGRKHSPERSVVFTITGCWS
jgi:hypothetical protein